MRITLKIQFDALIGVHVIGKADVRAAFHDERHIAGEFDGAALILSRRNSQRTAAVFRDIGHGRGKGVRPVISPAISPVVVQCIPALPRAALQSAVSS